MAHLQRKGAYDLCQQQLDRLVSLRWRLTAMLGLILLCTLVVISAIVIVFVRNTEATAWSERQSETASHVAQEVSNLVQQVSTVLNLINAFRIDELENESDILQNILRNNPTLTEVAYFNTQGDVIAHATLDNLFLLTNSGVTVGIELARPGESRVTEQQWFIATRHGQIYFDVAQFTIHSETGYTQQYLLFAMPAANKSSVVARIHISELYKIVADMRLGNHGSAYVVNQQGAIIAHSDRRAVEEHPIIRDHLVFIAAATTDDTQISSYQNFRGEDVIGVIARIPRVNWIVVTEVPQWEAYATSRRAYVLLGSGMLAFVILIMWASAEWMEGLILTPVERLRDGAERIGQGDLTHRIELLHQDEIGQVAHAFNQMAGELQDLYDDLEYKIAERTKQLEEQKQELARSNAELAQFAYIASHDLQEPLRMIVNYLQLIEHRYQDQLDDDADEFIGYAVDGAARMQQLIRDLLAYSRIGSSRESFCQVDIDQVVRQVLANLQVAIKEKQAVIHVGPLPQVTGDPTQLGQLFQNLLTNALKFTTNTPPLVEISAHCDVESQEWRFSIRDNGIGIVPDYHERIFLIFQRLHTRGEYSGTGIGLAICKKIVERHGGRIWIASQQIVGTTVYFTLPIRDTVLNEPGAKARRGIASATADGLSSIMTATTMNAMIDEEYRNIENQFMPKVPAS